MAMYMIYSDRLKLRMPFWKCHFELYARRFGNLECLPTPCFPNMIKNLKIPDILQVSGLFLLQSDRLTVLKYFFPRCHGSTINTVQQILGKHRKI